MKKLSQNHGQINILIVLLDYRLDSGCVTGHYLIYAIFGKHELS